jgi:hypothetical protein
MPPVDNFVGKKGTTALSPASTQVFPRVSLRGIAADFIN